jgi:hypothetical protein
MKINELFDELQAEIDRSKTGFGRRKLDALIVEDILNDMREALTHELEAARKVIENEQSIIEAAKKKAADILDNVDVRLGELIDENKVTQLAYEKSNHIVDNANKQAHELKAGSISYAVEVLDDVLGYLQEYMDIVNENKSNFVIKKDKDQASF